ncbi:MAG: sirohydrochlorin nickelochelatase [Methanimicrococcus sp.]|nr:sirohydrochlorin nickelochelatase [Methanimicrococcus sp.]
MVKETLFLVGHGSKLPYSKQLLVDISEKVKAKNEFENVEIGLMEFNEPSIPDTLKKIIEGGSKKIVVVPVFLALGTHTEKDIPRILGLLKEEETKEEEHEEKEHEEKHVCCGHRKEHGHHEGHGHHDEHQCRRHGGHGHHHHHHHHADPVDIPDDVEIIYKKPLGADDRIVEIIMERALKD